MSGYLVAGVIVATLVLTGCGESSDNGDSPQPNKGAANGGQSGPGSKANAKARLMARTRARFRARQRARQHALGGSGAVTHRPIRRRRAAAEKWRWT